MSKHLYQKLTMIFTAITAITVLTACQTKEPPAVTHQQQLELAQLVESQSIQSLTALNNCTSVGGDLASKANDIKNQLLSEHSKLMIASEQLLGNERADWVAWEGMPVSMKTLHNYVNTQASTVTKMNLANRSPTARLDTCSNAFTQAQNGMQMSGKERIIAAIYAATSSNTTRDSAIVFLSDMLPELPEAGQTYFTLSQSLSKSCSSSLELLTLLNEWPLETYAAYCNGNGQALVNCEWGKCSQSATSSSKFE